MASITGYNKLQADTLLAGKSIDPQRGAREYAYRPWNLNLQQGGARSLLVGHSIVNGDGASTEATKFKNILSAKILAVDPTANYTADGNSGYTSAQLLTKYQAAAAFSSPVHLVMFMGMVNDFKTNVAPATTQSNIQAFITQIRALQPSSAPTPSFVILIEWAAGNGLTTTYPWSQYVAAAKAVAAADPTVAVLDLEARMGDPAADAYSLYLTSDYTHPNDAGHALLARLVAEEVLRTNTPARSRVIAATDPTTTSDSTVGIVVGAEWVNTATKTVYTCIDNTATAAIWQRRTVDVQIFTTTGASTWTKPAWATTVEALLLSGGGGGGSGAVQASGAACSGGAGGSGGGFTYRKMSAAVAGATETVTVGAGGTGGAAQATNATAGNAGTSGGSTTFGNHARATATGAGSGGVLAGNSTTGSIGGGSSVGGSGGTCTSGAAGSAAGSAAPGAPGGSAGGGISTTPAAFAGAAGGISQQSNYSGGTAGTAGGGAGGVGTPTTTNEPAPGGGGGGGGSSITGNGGAGGAGGNYGAGGGGGGSALNGSTSGAGGNGAPGIVVVITS